MRLKVPEYRVEDTLPESQSFSVRLDAQMFRTLIVDLYPNPVEATIRELLSNALDAHVEAGCTAIAVDLEFPTAENGQQFRVRDYGNGMDHAFVMANYSTVGHSEKRRTNALTGGFGIGSKTPFTVVELFTVTVYSGTSARMYVCHYNDEQMPVVSLAYEIASPEPRGTAVAFKCPNALTTDMLRYCSDNFWRYDGFNIRLLSLHPTSWGLYRLIDDARVDVSNYEAPRNSQETWKQHVYMLKGPPANNFWYRQGSAVYPGLVVSRDLFERSAAIVIDVPVGTFQMTPARDKIVDNPENRAADKLWQERARTVIAEVVAANAATIKSWKDYRTVMSPLPELLRRRVRDHFQATAEMMSDPVTLDEVLAKRGQMIPNLGLSFQVRAEDNGALVLLGKKMSTSFFDLRLYQSTTAEDAHPMSFLLCRHSPQVTISKVQRWLRRKDFPKYHHVVCGREDALKKLVEALEIYEFPAQYKDFEQVVAEIKAQPKPPRPVDRSSVELTRTYFNGSDYATTRVVVTDDKALTFDASADGITIKPLWISHPSKTDTSPRTSANHLCDIARDDKARVRLLEAMTVLTGQHYNLFSGSKQSRKRVRNEITTTLEQEVAHIAEMYKHEPAEPGLDLSLDIDFPALQHSMLRQNSARTLDQFLCKCPLAFLLVWCSPENSIWLALSRQCGFFREWAEKSRGLRVLRAHVYERNYPEPARLSRVKHLLLKAGALPSDLIRETSRSSRRVSRRSLLITRRKMLEANNDPRVIEAISLLPENFHRRYALFKDTVKCPSS